MAEPIYNLMLKDKLVETGTLDQCLQTLIDMVGIHTGIGTLLEKGWRIKLLNRRANDIN